MESFRPPPPSGSGAAFDGDPGMNEYDRRRGDPPNALGWLLALVLLGLVALVMLTHFLS